MLFPFGDKANGSAEDQGVAHIPVVKTDGPVHCRDAHLVAVIANPAHDPLHHPPGMQCPRRKLSERIIRTRETEDIRVRHRLGREPRAQDIADHAADPGVSAAERLQGRRVVMRLDLETDVILVIELDDPGIVMKD